VQTPTIDIVDFSKNQIYSDSELSPRVVTPRKNKRNSATLDTELSKDWNKELQNLIYKPDSLQKFKDITSLANDFLYVAETYGRIIISEQFLPYSAQAIKPVTMGIAGGKKFLVQNIFFKFATDPLVEGIYLYGNSHEDTEKAMKATCNEIKALNSVIHAHCPMFHFPLMTIIQRRGFCLNAVSVLPLNGRESIRYGSADGGRTITVDESLVDSITQLRTYLNLAEHIVCDKSVFGPGDLEIHLGSV